ncbi:MAG: cytochrome c biogenesis protein ResB [Akkermansia sp.]|nr:cytochrome c biogenesis protein ResB [Akkermansia sp.]
MGTAGRITLMALGAGLVLLLGGGCPALGAPEVYRGGAMLALAGLVAALGLWGAYALGRGKMARLVLGMLFLYMAVVGLVVLRTYGLKGIEYCIQGGPMIFGAVGQFCYALVGVIFTAVFGYLVSRIMNRRLWLAGLHLCVAAVVCGAFIDYACEVKERVTVPANGTATIAGAQGEPLDFSLRVLDFQELFYDDAPTYSMYTMEAGGAGEAVPVPCEDGVLLAGDARVPVAELRSAPDMPRPFKVLAGDPPRVVLQNPPAVREYSSNCEITTTHRGREEKYTAALRVNAPLSCKGWQIYLEGHGIQGGQPAVTLLLRRAPGRITVLTGMAGIIICTACWCWWKKEDDPA